MTYLAIAKLFTFHHREKFYSSVIFQRMISCFFSRNVDEEGQYSSSKNYQFSRAIKLEHLVIKVRYR